MPLPSAAPFRPATRPTLPLSLLILSVACATAFLIYAGRPAAAVAVVVLLAGLGLAGRRWSADRQRAADALRELEKYRGMFENATEGIFQTAPDGRYLGANPALAPSTATTRRRS